MILLALAAAYLAIGGVTLGVLHYVATLPPEDDPLSPWGVLFFSLLWPVAWFAGIGLHCAKWLHSKAEQAQAEKGNAA